MITTQYIQDNSFKLAHFIIDKEATDGQIHDLIELIRVCDYTKRELYEATAKHYSLSEKEKAEPLNDELALAENEALRKKIIAEKEYEKEKENRAVMIIAKNGFILPTVEQMENVNIAEFEAWLDYRNDFAEKVTFLYNPDLDTVDGIFLLENTRITPLTGEIAPTAEQIKNIDKVAFKEWQAYREKRYLIRTRHQAQLKTIMLTMKLTEKEAIAEMIKFNL